MGKASASLTDDDAKLHSGPPFLSRPFAPPFAMNTQPGTFGRKIGSTQLFEQDGSVTRVTVIEAGPVVVLSKRTPEKDGYSALVLGMEDRKDKHTSKPRAGYFKKAGVSPKRLVKELRCDAEFASKWDVGATLKLDEIFQPGMRVDARGTTRGRGFTGVVRRWGFAGAVTTHGTHEYRRHPGSIGTNMTPGRTLPNLKMGGQYGNETVSMLNLKVARVDAAKHLLLVAGAIPGARNGIVLVRRAVKAPKKSTKR
jgi:large subunit ribosomal protein L3